jgi:hypothetical protein
MSPRPIALDPAVCGAQAARERTLAECAAAGCPWCSRALAAQLGPDDDEGRVS